MMKMKSLLMTTLATLLLMGCNMGVELCDETTHPHTPEVRFHYEFNDGESPYDSMFILSTRVINFKKIMMEVDPNPYWAKGTYVLNAPMVNQTDYTIDETTGDWWYIDDPYRTPMDKFRLPVGWYRFLSFNKDTHSYDASSLMRFYEDESIPLDSVKLNYQTYERTSSELVMPVIAGKSMEEWEDNNSYSNFVQTEPEPIYYDSIMLKEIQAGDTIINFHPNNISEHLNIYFTIDKDISKQPFTIEGVGAEISGIPSGIKLCTTELDVSKTHKMLFSTKLENTSGTELTDTKTNKTVVCHGTINALGVIQNTSKESNVGTGVLQVVIFLKKIVGNKSILRRVQGRINIYSALEKAQIVTHDEDYRYFQANRTGDIRVEYKISLDGNGILNPGGILQWEAQGGKDLEEAVIEEM